ncbi:hypothetical protein F4808DRAFT_467680 [Astrocystis sublimbata]|nr:hypothetical protein F4808DRAFT_467680 [Astrocystis sublimbata]
MTRHEVYSLAAIWLRRSLHHAMVRIRRLVVCVFAFFIVFVWYLSGIPDIHIDLERFTNANKQNVGMPVADIDSANVSRIIIFGGGDIATPNTLVNEWDSPGYGWTEIMCHELKCDKYLSFVPRTQNISGVVVSNSLLDSAYRHLSTLTGNSNGVANPNQLDYTWVEKQYPKPDLPDLSAQIDAFLASQTEGAAIETLWVFNVGYWDIWYLIAMPRQLATQVMELAIHDMFFQIERLFRAARDRNSTAFTEHPPTPENSPNKGPTVSTGKGARASFRIFFTKVFDISMTPGFAAARPKPPHPNSNSSDQRNAEYLTNYWNALLDSAVEKWLATPDPEFWSTDDKMDTEVESALSNKKPLPHYATYRKHFHMESWQRGGITHLPCRESATYGISQYILEHMIDHQLKGTALSDHNGMGERHPEEEFLEITHPCASARARDEPLKFGQRTIAGRKMVVCGNQDVYLFYNGFTVGKRAMREIGVSAARQLLEQVDDSSKWKKMTNLSMRYEN